MKRRGLVFAGILPAIELTACASGFGDHERAPGIGLIVAYDLGPAAQDKVELEGVSDTGSGVFSSAILGPRNGGVSTYGGAKIPKWVDVTWREAVVPGRDRMAGAIIANHRVEVFSRIPKDVLAYAKGARGRALRLSFRIKDNGVLFAWDVQEDSPLGKMYIYKMHGGDFLDPTIVNGKLIDPGWEK